jgi:hypothetical protein
MTPDQFITDPFGVLLGRAGGSETPIIQQVITEISAFEVMPNKVEIPAGTVDEITGLTYSRAVPACTTHKMTLRSTQEPDACDVVIDWGDGTVEAIKDGYFTGHTAGKAYELEHDYSQNMTADIQRFVVKIKGKDYYTFRHNSYKNNNLISRIFDAGFPIAGHITNFASMVVSADRLLKVHFPHSTAPFSNAWNWSSCFNECPNVVSITGFEDLAIRGDACFSGFMAACGSLKTTDFVIPATVTKLENIFTGDTNLECDINSLIPKQGFAASNILTRAPFGYLKKVYGTVPADKLWNDKRINWIFEHATDRPFRNCSDEIRAQVPVAWGGTNTDI